MKGVFCFIWFIFIDGEFDEWWYYSCGVVVIIFVVFV